MERQYIEDSTDGSNHKSPNGDTLTTLPVREIATSVPVLANVLTSMGHSYGSHTLLSMTPTYLNNIQHFNIESVSLHAYMHM